MDGGAEPDAEPGIDEGPVVAVSPTDGRAARQRVLMHAMIPLVFGAVVGTLWQVFVTPMLGPTQMPNPVHGALLASLLLSPVAHRLLARRPMEEWWEYGTGWAAVGLPLSLIWTIPGPQALLCGGYVLGVLWMSITSAWSMGPKPPFRLAIWHMMGVGVGALRGGILGYGWS